LPKIADDEGLGITGLYVVGLVLACGSMLVPGMVLVTDNFFTLEPLAKWLLQHRICALETVLTN